MKFAIPTAMIPVGEIKEIAIAAEINGFHSIAVSDHLFHPKEFSVPYPYTPDGSVRWEEGTDWPDPINLLSFLAGATTNLNFYTSIYILPARNVLRVAKEVATLSNLSNGRFSLGIGMGWLPEEFELGGIPFTERGKRADEMLQILKELWTGKFVEFSGKYASFKSLQSLPTPSNQSIPILVGGFSDPAGSENPPTKIGILWFDGVGSDCKLLNDAYLPLNSTNFPVHNSFKICNISSARFPLSVKGIPPSSNSSGNQPIPIPKENLPLERLDKVATSLATRSTLRAGKI